MIISKRCGVFMVVATCVTLATVCILATLLISHKMAVDNAEVRGLARDYDELIATPVIGERISYFPRAAKSIEYWCRQNNYGIYGSFEIDESAYLDWARGMGWQLREIRSTEAEPWLLVKHPDGSEEYLERPKNSYFYKPKSFKQRDFRIVYDRDRKRAYFEDSNGRIGPPSGNASADEDVW